MSGFPVLSPSLERAPLDHATALTGTKNERGKKMSFENKFDDDYGPNKGHCDKCRKAFSHDLEIYLIIFDPPSEGLGKIIKSNEKVRVCRNCYGQARVKVMEIIFGGRTQ